MTGLEQHLEAIEMLEKQKLFLPAVTLVFVVIESLAWVDYGDTVPSKTRFLNWTSKHLLPVGDKGVSAIDLYGARCGMLHTGTSESSLSNGGTARKVGYYWGELAPLLERLGHETADEMGLVLLKIEDLVTALRRAIKSSMDGIESDVSRREEVGKRIQKMFVSLSDNKVYEEAVTMLDGMKET